MQVNERPVALVTGGSGGIGSAICSRLAEAGYRIVLTCRKNAEAAEATRAGLSGSGHLARAMSASDSTDVRALVETIRRDCGRLDLVVNNAGMTFPVAHDDLQGLTDSMIDEIFAVNWRGPYAVCRESLPLMREGGGGLIINISSVAGTTGLGSNVAYCASKAALDSMTRSLARALAPEIRVLSIAPGWVDGEYARRMPEALIHEQVAATPLARIASPEDVAEAVYAAAAHLRFTTGVVIPVDGGRPLGQ